jgi:hypothetical protein
LKLQKGTTVAGVLVAAMAAMTRPFSVTVLKRGLVALRAQDLRHGLFKQIPQPPDVGAHTGFAGQGSIRVDDEAGLSEAAPIAGAGREPLAITGFAGCGQVVRPAGGFPAAIDAPSTRPAPTQLRPYSVPARPRGRCGRSVHGVDAQPGNPASLQCVVYLGETPIVVASKNQGHAADSTTFDQSHQISLDPMLRVTAGAIDAYIGGSPPCQTTSVAALTPFFSVR